MKKWILFFILVLFIKPMSVHGEDISTLEEFYEEAELNEAGEIAEESGIDFMEILENVYNVDSSEGVSWLTAILKSFISNININWSAMRHVFMLSCLGAMLTAVSETFGSRQAGDMGFYICYLSLMGILTTAFYQTLGIVEDLLSLVLKFMRAILPAYYISIYLTIGSADGFYGIVITALSLLERIIKSIFLPGVKLYLVLMLLNHLQHEDYLSKMAELIKTVLDWAYKSIFAAVLGLQLVQSLIAPYKAAITKNLLVKAAAAIPGIGSSISGVSTVIIGSGMLIKNTVGVSAVIVIILMCSIPIIKLLVSAFLYQSCAALIQPFADKCMVGAVDAAAEAVKLLLKFLLISVLMLIITLAILCTLKPA